MNNNSSNQAKNVGASSSLLGRSGIAPYSQQYHPNLMNNQQQWTNVLSRSHPQANFHSHFQFSEPQSQHSQVFSQPQFAQLRASLQQLPSQIHPVTPLHNVNANVAFTPGTGSSKRATTQRASLRTAGSVGLNQMESTPVGRRRKRELPDKQMSGKVAAVLPESALYTQLRDFEARVDDELVKAKVDVQEVIRSSPHVQKTLRIYVFNTFSNHAKSGPEDETNEGCSWSLKIIGRILEDGNDTVPGILQRTSPSDTKFSDFFKKITICLDQNLYPENHIIVWDSAFSPKQQDGFEVKRKGDKEFTAVIKIELKYSPEKFVVSAPVSNILGIEVGTRPRVIAALWHYVKSMRLRCLDEPSSFFCDPSLRRVFGEEKMEFTTAAKKLLEHLSKPQPLYLEHNIKLSGNCPVGTACYDVLVDMPIPLQKEMSRFLASNSIDNHKEIESYDEIISNNLKKIQEHRRRRAFFLSFSQSPQEFINAMITSKSKDLKLVAGDPGRNSEREQGSECYNQPWVEDAVIRYLNRKAAGKDAPDGN